MDYVKKVKSGNRLIYCSIKQFSSADIFKEKINKLNKYLTEYKIKFKSIPDLNIDAEKYFVRIYGLEDVKLWDTNGVIK